MRRGAIGFVSLKSIMNLLNLCILFEKLNKINEPLVPLSFDLDQLPSHNQAINCIQYMLKFFQFADPSTLKQWRSLNRKKLNFLEKTKINFKRPYLSRNNSTIIRFELTTMMVSLHGAGFIPIFIPQLFWLALLPPVFQV
ncbi:hypothetical protein VP01_7659g1 [Puccinia sorghi]|uniref:Uncharacterized protein n=1 Tax=Puccinia sorghi TaxID=27349 RepID=A0A0L6UDU1_9BASI|nr:hypothetical protein VP01_7659g1 [Puccinia sorghi]